MHHHRPWRPGAACGFIPKAMADSWRPWSPGCTTESAFGNRSLWVPFSDCSSRGKGEDPSLSCGIIHINADASDIRLERRAGKFMEAVQAELTRLDERVQPIIPGELSAKERDCRVTRARQTLEAPMGRLYGYSPLSWARWKDLSLSFDRSLSEGTKIKTNN